MTKTSNRDLTLKATTSEQVYRTGTQSGATWALILANPLKSFREYVAMGGRENTIADAIRKGHLIHVVATEDAKTKTIKRLAKELATKKGSHKGAEFGLTEKEAIVMKAIVNSEYGHRGDNIWTFSVTDTGILPKASFGGIFASLVSKGLIWVRKADHRDDDDGCGFTEEGQKIADTLWPE